MNTNLKPNLNVTHDINLDKNLKIKMGINGYQKEDENGIE